MTDRPRLVCTLALLAAAASASCASRTGSPDARAPGRITGHVVGEAVPPDAVVEVYRDAGRVHVPLTGTSVTLDSAGKFSTPPLPPGRYLVVLRTRERPPSLASATVPTRRTVDLRPAASAPGGTMTLVSPAEATGARTCRLVPRTSRDLVPDRREVTLAPGGEASVHGLAPGTWHLDVLPDGVTTDVEVREGSNRFVVDPPHLPVGGGTLEGFVLRLRGEPAWGAAVTARSSLPDGRAFGTWGRFSPVGRDGRYRIERLEPGRTFARVELRDVSYRLLPPPEWIEISPREPVQRGFTVEP